MPDDRLRLTIVPCSFAEAVAFVTRYHRHLLPSRSHKFSLAVADERGMIRGVAIVGRPIARHLDTGWTLEITRLATDGWRCLGEAGGGRWNRPANDRPRVDRHPL